MKHRTWVLLAVMAVASAVAAGAWFVRESRANAAKIEAEIVRGLTEEQVVMLLKNQQLVEPSRTYAVVATQESRTAFLNGMREYLALAAPARQEGIADQPAIRRILQYKADALLFSLYQNRLDNEKGGFFELPKDQVDAFLIDPQNGADFDADMAALKQVQRSVLKNTGNPLPSPPPTDGEAATKTRENWAKAKILSSMARNDQAFINDPAVYLRLKILEAGVLASNYLNKYWAEKIKPVDAEITEYVKVHPEYDPKVKRDLAEKVLARVKTGEDFDALAKEFSEDRTNKSQGGIYKDVEPGFLWPEVEQAAFSLQPGQIAERLIETKDGWHIVGLVKRSTKKAADGREIQTMDVRHILLQRKFEEPGPGVPGIPPPFLSPREIAEAALTKQKRQSFIDDVIAGEKITLPEDFAFEITDELKNSGMRIENKLGEIEAEEKEALRSQEKQSRIENNSGSLGR